MSEDTIASRLDEKFRRESGGSRGVAGVAVLSDGHAGLTYEFSVVDARSGEALEDYVLKLAPPGVVRRGNTDVYRQAPLLQALGAAGLPVPKVPFASPEEEELGTPYIVMERLPGRSFVPWEPNRTFDLSHRSVEAIWRTAAEALAAVHDFDWRTHLADWEAPRSLAAEAAYWTPLLDKADDKRLQAKGNRLAEELAASLPTNVRIGLVHGDYQPGNILYDDGRLTGIIDWELASIGAQGLDLGWLAMMADGSCWLDGWRPVSVLGPAEIGEIYEQKAGRPAEHRDWFQALACFRMGAIGCLNVKLHRSGRRVDDIWERFAPGLELLFERGLELAISAPAKTQAKVHHG